MEIYVTNLAYGTAAADLLALFSPDAQSPRFRARIKEVRQMPSREIRTYGYVSTEGASDGEAAMLRCHGARLNGQVISCVVAG